MKRIAAVVVTYNRKELLSECIQNLLEQDFRKIYGERFDLHILVIDNASTDGTSELFIDDKSAQAVEGWQAGNKGKQADAETIQADTDVTSDVTSDVNPDVTSDVNPDVTSDVTSDVNRTCHFSSQISAGVVRYFNTGANLGGAGGFNFGMRKAVELGYDYVWAMDDDCITHHNTLSAFLEADAKLKGRYGFLSSVVRWFDGNVCTFNVPRHPLTKSITDFSKPLQQASVASFVSLFVPATIIKELGLPVSEFFIWTDDWEFTRRISRKHPCYLVGNSEVTHKTAVNGGGNIALDPEEKIPRYWYAYRNEVVLYRREGIRGLAYVFVRGAYHTFLVLTKAKSKKGLRIKTIFKGNIAGLKFHPHIEYIS